MDMPFYYMNQKINNTKPMKNIVIFFSVIGLMVIACTPSCDQAYPDGMDLDEMDANNRAMNGLDVVSFYTSNKSTPGLDALVSVHNGVKYLFSSPKNKTLFDTNPEKYMPHIGGFCVVAAAHGKVEVTDREHYGVYNGKLYFATNKKAFDMWLKDQEGITTQGESMWPCLVAQEGRKI